MGSFLRGGLLRMAQTLAAWFVAHSQACFSRLAALVALAVAVRMAWMLSPWRMWYSAIDKAFSMACWRSMVLPANTLTLWVCVGNCTDRPAQGLGRGITLVMGSAP